jgi:hypothetical protein
MNKLLFIFCSLTLCIENVYARNVYFFDIAEISVNVHTRVNEKQTRKVYVFDDSNIIRAKDHSIPEGFTVASSSLDMGAAYRTGEVAFNIGYPDDPVRPNILSDLEWSDLLITQISFNSAISFKNRMRLGLDFGVGVISDGNGRDSDYNLDNKQGEYSRSVNTVYGHETVDVSFFAGYEFPIEMIESTNTIFTPLFGYSYSEQNIQRKDGIQVIPDNGPFSGLNGAYDTVWYGPWLGFGLEVSKGLWSLEGRYSHHFVDYEAVGEWNLRTDLAQPKSLEHLADGEGDRFSAKLSRFWLNNWHAFVDFGIENWQTNQGTDIRYFANGNVSSNTVLNSASWNSWWAGIGVKRYF